MMNDVKILGFAGIDICVLLVYGVCQGQEAGDAAVTGRC